VFSHSQRSFFFENSSKGRRTALFRCLKIDFVASTYDLDRLFQCNRISALIWNTCLDVAKEYALANGGKWINKPLLQKALKVKIPLHGNAIELSLGIQDGKRSQPNIVRPSQLPAHNNKEIELIWAV